jgi:hypothetical protein
MKCLLDNSTGLRAILSKLSGFPAALFVYLTRHYKPRFAFINMILLQIPLTHSSTGVERSLKSLKRAQYNHPGTHAGFCKATNT